ncbi:hypothetical protein [Phaeobacter italicus]|uniref:hypothetical protein n=1 Tax=Phaeobacter italicus TaxID=481446 RepID=UPI0023307E6A|nr:hypothetical protein [Phaeobacter italicus]
MRAIGFSRYSAILVRAKRSNIKREEARDRPTADAPVSSTNLKGCLPMLTNHFSLKLLETFSGELEALGITACAFLAAARHRPFDPGTPPASKANFAEACNVICELFLPRQTSLAHISFSSHCPEAAGIAVSYSSTASTGGSAFMASLSADAGKAMVLHDLLAERAKKLGLKIA